MRDILFRGKRLDNGEWVDGNLFAPDKVSRMDAPTEILVGTNIVRISYEVDPATVGQYTGLMDMAGRRIFEGDLVSKNGKRMFVVEYSSDIASFMAYPMDDGLSTPCMNTGTMRDYQIVGNIHDSHDLMEG